MEWVVLAIVLAFGIYGLVCPDSHLTPGFVIAFLLMIFLWLGISG